MKDWYEKRIEEPVRDIVRLLRDNGFNTECSCGHEMYIQCQYLLDGEFQRLHKLIYDYLHDKGEKIDFEIEMKHKVLDGCGYSHFDIKFPPLNCSDEWLQKQKEHYIKMRDYFEERIQLIEEDMKSYSDKTTEGN